MRSKKNSQKQNLVVNDEKLLRFVIDTAVGIFRPHKIILFGSRARGDANPKSDYDLAFAGDNISEVAWFKFKDLIEESAPTLHRLDLVNLNAGIAEDLVEAIFKEGTVIYERQK